MIEIAGLVRTYSGRGGWWRGGPEVAALDGVDLVVRPGEIVGCLGPNGAGKSTLVKCETGVLPPSAGSVRVCGLDPWTERRRALSRIGVVFGHRPSLWLELGVRDGLGLVGAMYGVPRARIAEQVAALAERLDVAHLLDARVRTLSLGERVRCDLLAALLPDPAVLVLDEPTVGLDPAARQRFREVLAERAASGTAVFLTSHELADVAALCPRVIALRGGRVAFDGPFSELRARLVGSRRLVVERGSETLDVHFDGPAGPVVRQALEQWPDAADLRIEEASLERALAPLYASDGR